MTKSLAYIIGASVTNIVVHVSIVWALWYWLCPLFNLPPIDWLESWGIWTLVRCLVGGSVVKVDTK